VPSQKRPENRAFVWRRAPFGDSLSAALIGARHRDKASAL
jgi:hypothetical protein